MMSDDVNNETLRLFIAVNLSDGAMSEIDRSVGIMKKIDARIKWVIPSAVHLTLKFLGDVAYEKIESISRALKKSLSGVKPFSIGLGELGVFPFWRDPKIIWIGISEGKTDILDLADIIERSMRGEGFEKEKHAFRPHITIGRVKSDPKRAIYAKKINAIGIKPVVSLIDKVTLFRSNLTQEGAVHTPVETFPLGTAADDTDR